VRDLLAAPPEVVAPALLGALVVSDLDGEHVVARVVEVEAYGGEGTDPASHAHRGLTRRNAVMFGPPGHAYVYFTYGRHWCLNVVTGRAGQGSAVLLRAAAVVDGVDLLDPQSSLRLLGSSTPGWAVEAGPRVGVRLAADRPWRFWLADTPEVSAYRRGGRRRAQ
jgi:DNA-3-methyladenine glycosylase